jgi:hypothetical protein
MHPVHMSGCASIGFRLHTGWAMLVAVAAEGEALRVVHRCRVELFPPSRGRFVYHEAEELPLPDAGRLIESVRHTAEDTARTAVRSAIKNLKVTGACIPTGSASVPNDLAAVLGSHARIHAAEGALYAGAIASACEHFHIPLITVRERDVWSRASTNAGMSEADLRARIDAVRKTLGPPWTADHKIATAAALVRA